MPVFNIKFQGSKAFISNSIDEAIVAYEAIENNSEIHSINGKSFFGFCEESGKPVCEGDDFLSDPSGVLILRNKRSQFDV